MECSFEIITFMGDKSVLAISSVAEGSCVYQNTIHAYDGNLAPLSLQIYSVCLWDQLSGSLLC